MLIYDLPLLIKEEPKFLALPTNPLPSLIPFLRYLRTNAKIIARSSNKPPSIANELSKEDGITFGEGVVVGVIVCVGVLVWVGVLVGVEVLVGVNVLVCVGVLVGVEVLVGVNVLVGRGGGGDVLVGRGRGVLVGGATT